jgi:hypothetical protein
MATGRIDGPFSVPAIVSGSEVKFSVVSSDLIEINAGCAAKSYNPIVTCGPLITECSSFSYSFLPTTQLLTVSGSGCSSIPTTLQIKCADASGAEINSPTASFSPVIDCSRIDKKTAKTPTTPHSIAAQLYSDTGTFDMQPSDVFDTYADCASNSFEPIVSCTAASVGLTTSCVSEVDASTFSPMTITMANCPGASQFKLTCRDMYNDPVESEAIDLPSKNCQNILQVVSTKPDPAPDNS